ncbi:MAG: polyketide cyclase [Thauera phenolivorans]|uniref:Polyketide cyclase n=1 Tax=Thauera phenolivorans TaxID=1792543 RepID=A0A7X7R7E5_9RHOO|nr:SRPBCC family protein [Thauera phenolivorans]NLF53471.1 polyketide cyclase [Thauera phenolivorans]
MRPSNYYELTTVWQFDAPIEAVWAALVDAENWPRWWPGIEQVAVLDRGDADGVGARRCYTCRSLLPYRLRFVSRVTRVEPLQLLEGRVEGELEGRGCCRLTHSDGHVFVRYDWQVRTTRRWMNLLAPLAKPLFRWNHDKLMEAGGSGLARHLKADTDARTV